MQKSELTNPNTSVIEHLEDVFALNSVREWT